MSKRVAKIQDNAGMSANVQIPLNYIDFQQIVVNDIKKLLSDNNQFRPRKYDRDQLRRFMGKPEDYQQQLREVSHYFMITSSHYRRLMGYFSNMLTLDYILMPTIKYDKLSGTAAEVFRRNYERSTKYLENYNVKHELGKVVKVLLTDGVYFGYERQEGDSFALQRLPSQFCKITGTEDGVISFAFNFQFFKNESMLQYYPEEFKVIYALAKQKQQWWQELDTAKAACFKYDEENLIYSIPPFSGVFEDIMDLEDYKDLQKIKTKLDNYKLLVQKIPMKKDPKSEKDFVLTLDSVKMFHNNIKAVIPDQVGIISTPMDLTDFDFEKARQKEDTVGNAHRNYYDSAGVSAPLFNAGDSTIGLNRSINVDEAIMFPLLRQFEKYFKRRLSQVNTKTYPFKAWLPDITVFNRLELLGKVLQTAQYGFPKSLVAACLGMSINDLTNLSAFENDFLGLEEMLIPLNSSHNMSPTATGTTNGGRPKKSDTQISDSGATTRDKNKNGNRAK